MSAEAISLARRASMHAALGEPGRLALMDALALGEASPGELGQRLGMASNLAAHHLRVLERAGLVARHRSEGDRRRSYVGLVRGALEGLLPPVAMPLAGQRVVFVCTHNSARSQLAAAMWSGTSTVPATSAGTQPAARVHPGAVAVADRRHLSLVSAPPRHVRSVLAPTDLVVTVCDSAHEELAQHVDPSLRAALHWSIPDPARHDDPTAFDRVVDELADRIPRLSSAVTEPHEHRRTS